MSFLSVALSSSDESNKPRFSLCTHAFHRMDPDFSILDG